MNLFGLEEFAAKRRTVQADLEDRLRPTATHAVSLAENTHGWEELLSQVRDLYSSLYYDETGSRGHQASGKWIADLRETLRKTTRTERSAENITVWLATALLSEVAVDSALADPEDLFLEWVDMGDSHVRESHRDAAGQTAPPGEKFSVGDVEMRKPGDTSVPIEYWINCRCTLRPVLASDALAASMSRIAAAVWQSDGRPEEARVDPKKKPFPPKKSPKDVEEDPNLPPQDAPLDDEQAPDEEDPKRKGKPFNDLSPVPFHTVLAPEGKRSGDGRRFTEGSLTARPLPLPLTWQKQSADGHGGNITVAKIEAIARVEGEMRGVGHFITNVEADEAIGLIGEFGRFGVSVDADEAVFDMSEDDEETVDFTAARICSACIVSIPAFAEAWVALGEAPEGFMGGDDIEETGEPLEDEALVASLESFFAGVDIFKDLAPGKTEDGPGWLTHPVDTDRLRDYWVSGPGAAEIGWGTPGDFNRCRLAVAEYIKPQYLAGYCANRHYDALGFWPGRPVAGDTTPFGDLSEKAQQVALNARKPAEALHLVASIKNRAPAAWFKDPEFSEGDGRMRKDKSGKWGCPLTVTDEGEVYGHIATWGECHIGFDGVCTTPPFTNSGYAYFLTGEVALDDGTRAACGPISLGGGHADPQKRLRAAVDHYDRTSAAVCDIAVGEDTFGIWFHGWVRPGTTDDQVTALMASPLSGDWRNAGGSLELVAALAVNTPGFHVPRVGLAASAGEQQSLVAAGAIEQPGEATPEVERIAASLAEEVANVLEARQERRLVMAALAAEFSEEK